MSGHLKAFIAILVVGSIAILGAKFVLPFLGDKLQRSTSDAAATHGVLRIGMDNWIGYFPLCSPEMTRRLRDAGYALRCEDDQADYARRFKRLKAGDIDFAVGTVDSYVLNGASEDYPGVVIAVIDESKGGDAIVARQDEIDNLSTLKDRQGVHVAFTPDSPSEYLLKSISTHFDLPIFRQKNDSWREESNGSSEALEKLLNNEVAVAVLWEPDVSKALAEPGIIKLIGTEDTDKLIVDILVVGRYFSQEHPQAVATLLHEYFETLRYYHDHPRQLRGDVVDVTGLDVNQVEAMLQGVEWATLNENGVGWYGITPSGQRGEEGLVDTITAAVNVLLANKDFDINPLPDQDPYRLTNRQFVADLYANYATNASVATSALATPFQPLDDQGWQALKEVGTLKVEPVSFRRSSGILDYEGKLILDDVAESLQRYPNFRIIIKGHTALSGDRQANLMLSAERAEAVARYLLVTYGMDDNRIRALGYGSSRPLQRLPGESDRSYAYRLPRVEITLATEAY
ncbi:MAG: phosphate ABC transporter substrate-binding/OmpA family protein [Pseudomonadota bacterium]